MIELSELTTKLLSFPPNITLVAPVKPEPVIVTKVPPASGPEGGVTVETTTGVPTMSCKSIAFWPGKKLIDPQPTAQASARETWKSKVPGFGAVTLN